MIKEKLFKSFEKGFNNLEYIGELDQKWTVTSFQNFYNEKLNQINIYKYRKFLSKCIKIYNLLNKTSHNEKEKVQLAMLKNDINNKIKELFDLEYDEFIEKYPDAYVGESFYSIIENKIYKFRIINCYENIYLEEGLRDEISENILENPEEEYIEARKMKRNFILHIGPTNSGKTYEAIERLKQSTNGIYLGPLRLLALEIYDKLNAALVPCDMITGEEVFITPNAVCKSCTIEILNIDEKFDIAVIDEGQMIADPFRGYNWTKAILGIQAEEIHICLAPEAKDIIIKLIERCGDSYEIKNHERSTKLTFINKEFKIKDIEKGDALIVFSKKSVLSVAAELEKHHIKSSIIYGNLPPVARRNQVEKFINGETDVVVSTDAIGMGLNLPIHRIVFLETEKFDGNTVRDLNTSEIKQIAGRAGRMGMYEEGFVLASNNRNLISNALSRDVQPIQKAYLGFPENLIHLPFKMNDTMKAWALIKAPSLYKKMKIDILLEMYDNLESNLDINEFNRKEIYKFITCPIDIKNDDVVLLWLEYCEAMHFVSDMTLPQLRKDVLDLNILETHYKKLDLYYQFSRKMNKIIDEENLAKEKEKTIKLINKVLDNNKNDFVKKCKICGKKMSYSSKYNICEKCYYFNYY
jgi:ATP-dependent RNA helicase SUPV3L1/SUV3